MVLVFSNVGAVVYQLKLVPDKIQASLRCPPREVLAVQFVSRNGRFTQCARMFYGSSNDAVSDEVASGDASASWESEMLVAL